MPAISAPLPADEEERIAALYSYQILDTPQETPYEEIVQLAAQICEAPISMISLVDTNRQWFKAKIGWDKEQTSREISFAAHTLSQTELLQLSNASRDPRFARNPLVLNHPNVRFYAGAPIRTAEGKVLGSLCVIDHTPRLLRFEQQRALMVLARQVMELFELRRTRQELKQARFELTVMSSRDELTGLCGRDALKQQLVQDCSDCRREHRPLSMLLMEPDRFQAQKDWLQAYKDYYGLDAADIALKEIAKILKSMAQPCELIARAEGALFAMLLPGRDMEAAYRLAERYREAIANALPERPLKVSIGLASRNPGGDPAILTEALAALKTAQKSGDSVERFQDVRAPANRFAGAAR